MQKFLILCAQSPVHFYRIFISPFSLPACRFQPTCSAYALEALERHGIFRGTFLAMCRLGRCHPWHNGRRYDPVPETAKGSIDRAGRIRYKRGKHARACAHNHENIQ
jgi:putative membrane protein insertion efficiency factor